MTSAMKHRLLVMGVMLCVASCAASDVPAAKSTAGRDPTIAEIPDKDETVRGDGEPAVVTLDLQSSLHEHRLTATDELPGSIIIPNTNLNGVPVTAALQAVLSGTDISLSWNSTTFGSKLVTVMNLSGPLPKVVNKICSAARVFCNYRHGSLELSEKETFVVNLPPLARTSSGGSSSSSSSSSISSASFANNTKNTMVETIDSLLDGEKARTDEQGENIVYTATVDAQDRVSQYLAQLRTGRPLIVLQMYIWEVELNSENAQGINWSSLKYEQIPGIDLSATNSLASAATTGSVSLGAVTTGIISSSSVASFIATKGRVQTISNPQITFVSGSSAQLRVGGTQRYISQVGTITSSNASGTSSGSTGNASTNTVSTDSIDTGLSISVQGSYENGVVFANLDLALKNLVSLNPTTSGGGIIDLPQTTDEKMNTVLRVRPGDSLVLAGLVSANDTQTRQGLPLPGDASVPLYGDAQRKNRELVIIVRPSVVLFSDKSATEEKKKKQEAKPLPDAVVIDKDGSRALTISQPAPVANKPELMQTEVLATSMKDIPLAPSDATAPVDKRLMQRGFSHAFDQLLKSPSDGGSQ